MKMGKTNNSTVPAFGMKDRLGYMFGDFGNDFTFILSSMFMMKFYTDVMGLSAGVVGMLMMAARFVDAFTDVTMGQIVDRSKPTKDGKFRPWIKRMCGPVAIASFLIYQSGLADMPYGVKVAYMVVTYLLWGSIFYTSINIPYGSMATMMTKDQYQRTLLNIFRQLFAQIASLLVTAGTLPLVDFITEYVGARKAWSIVYGIFGVIAAILFFLCFAGCKERIHENEETKTEKIRVVDGVKAVLKNKYWHMLMVISICINIFFQAISTVNTYYSKAVLHNSSMISILNTAYIVPAIATFFFVHLVVKKYGKGKTTMFGWMIICVSYVILLPFTENTTVLIITAAMRGVGYCFLLAVSSAMVSDAVEYGEWKTKIRVEGLTFSMQGFVGTIAAGIVTAVIGWVLNFSKYDGTLSFADTQAGSAVLAIKLLFIAVPFVVGVLNIILLKFYKLDKMYPQIIEDLNKRNGK